MQRADLSDLAAFAAVATHRSFRRAARELGLSPSALSHSLRGLETRMGVRLLHRTTRSVSPTEAGAALLARLGPALSDISDAMEAASLFRDGLKGTLRINAPRSACRLVLMPFVGRFLALHQGVCLELVSDNALSDMVAGGYDAGIRFGEHLARDMIAVPFGGPQRFALVGAPAYLDRHGTPTTPADLAGHACIRQRFPGGDLYRWEFERDGQDRVVGVEGPLILTDQDMMVQAAIDGIGLTFVFEGYAVDALGDGRLVRLMPDWCPTFPGFFLYYAGHRQMPPILRAFIDLLKQPVPPATATP